MWQSLVQFERFGETLSPGFFVIKLSLGLMAVLIFADAWTRALRRNSQPS